MFYLTNKVEFNLKLIGNTHTLSFMDNFSLFLCNKTNLLADKEFLSTEVVVVDDDVETSPNTEFMFEEFWAE